MDERIIPFLQEHALALILGVAGLLCLGYGVISLTVQPKGDDGIDFQSDSHSTTEKTIVSPKVGKQMTIDIEGAVEKPGVYTLPADSRIQDALITAGGLNHNVDRKKVSQTINLAAHLTVIVPNSTFLLLESNLRRLVAVQIPLPEVVTVFSELKQKW